jgi:WD40 repeat protein
VKLLWEALVGGRGRAVAVSKELGRVALSTGSRVLLYDLATGKAQGTLDGCSEVLRGGLAFAHGMLVVVCADEVKAYRGTVPVKLPIELAPARITAAHLSWPRLSAGHYDGVIRVYGLDGAPTLTIPVPGPPIDTKSLALTRDGSRLAVAWVQGSIWWWETARPDLPHELVRHKSESDSLAFSDDGQWLAEEGEPNFSGVWSMKDTPSVAHKIKNGAWIKRMVFTRDGRWLIRGGSDGLELAEIAGPRRVALDTRGAVEDIGVDEPGALVAAVDRDGRLTVWGVRG